MPTRAAMFPAAGIALLCCFASTAATHAAEIKVLSVNGVKLVLPDLVSNFEQGEVGDIPLSLTSLGIRQARD